MDTVLVKKARILTNICDIICETSDPLPNPLPRISLRISFKLLYAGEGVF